MSEKVLAEKDDGWVLGCRRAGASPENKQRARTLVHWLRDNHAETWFGALGIRLPNDGDPTVVIYGTTPAFGPEETRRLRSLLFELGFHVPEQFTMSDRPALGWILEALI